MALNFDHKTVPARPTELVALAEAVHGASPADESVWLEWKSTLELTKKAGWHHIARAIVGFANRMPDVAAAYTEGRAYLVVGIAPGSLAGVDPIDIVDLDQGLSPYLGKQPLRWRATYVPVTRDGHTAQVLVVEVDPPRWGDEIFCMCKEFDGVRDGTIFVRGNGFTLPATSSEVKVLGLRQKRGVQEIEVDLRVLKGTPVRPVETGSQAVEHWLAGKRSEAMASLRAQQTKATGHRSYTSGAPSLAPSELLSQAMAQSLGQLMKIEPENRTAEEYCAEVEQYLQACAEHWQAAVLPAAAVHITPVELELVNTLSTNLAEVEVQLYIPGDVEAVEPRPARALTAGEGFVRLPRPPRPYGPRQIPLLSGLPFGGQIPVRGSFGSPVQAAPLRPKIDNGGSAMVTFPPVHLRAEQRIQLDPIVVVVRAPAPPHLTCRWQATSTSMDGRFTGELVLDVGTQSLPLAGLLTEPAT